MHQVRMVAWIAWIAWIEARAGMVHSMVCYLLVSLRVSSWLLLLTTSGFAWTGVHCHALSLARLERSRLDQVLFTCRLICPALLLNDTLVVKG